MCGIVGYTGSKPAKDALINGLSMLEYRGYDSAGIAVLDGLGGMDVFRAVGLVDELKQLVAGENLTGVTGIGHTRWATHGKPSRINAHPHRDCSGKIAVVHNGIIENFNELRSELIARGHHFASETDTEVIPHLLEEAYQGDLKQAMLAILPRLQGAYGLACVHVDHPDEIVAVRKESPLVVGCSADCAVVASDTPAILDVTRDVVYPEDDTVVVLHSDGTAQFFDATGAEVHPKTVHLEWDQNAAKKDGYDDYMDKEIHEQPRVVSDTLKGRLKDGRVVIDGLELDEEDIAALDRVVIVACGTSYHAGLVAKYLIEAWARIPCDVEIASEFRYRDPIVSPSTLVIAITQSGETADTLAAVQLARTYGASVFAVTNRLGSRVTRECDGVIYARAGLEISVAATKSFLAQITALTLLAEYLAQVRHRFNRSQVRMFYHSMLELPQQIQQILDHPEPVRRAADLIGDATSALFIGRGIGYVVCMEGALKLKEISYVHAEAFAAGEIKHGPIALVTEQTPVVAVAVHSPTREKTVSNILELKARGARVIGIATEGDEEVERICDATIFIPRIRSTLSAITASVPLQMLARLVAIDRGCNVDKPRNLAKSVTVE